MFHTCTRPPCFLQRWEKAKRAREDKAKEEKEKQKAEAKPTLGDSLWGGSVEKEEEVSRRVVAGSLR